MADSFVLDAPGIAKLAAQLAAMLRQDADLRSLQSANAPQATAFDDQTTPGISGVNVYAIADAQSRDFYSLVLTFSAASGSGRYRIDGPAPGQAVGVPIPAGGVVLNIVGANNVRNFKMIPEAGQTLTFARYLFI